MPHTVDAKEESDVVHGDHEEEQRGELQQHGRDLGQIWRHAKALVASMTVATGLSG